MTGAKNAGLDIGVYFFSQAVSKSEIEEEVETFLEAIKDYSVNYPVVFMMQEVEGDMARVELLDTESRTSLAKTFLEKVKSRLYANALR